MARPTSVVLALPPRSAVFGPPAAGLVLAVRPRGGQFTTQTIEENGYAAGLLPATGNRLTVLDTVAAGAGVSSLRYRDRLPTAALTDPVVIATDTFCSSAGVVTPTDDTIIAFDGACGRPNDGGVIELAERPSGGVFSPPLPISVPGAGLLDVAVNPSGAVAVAWSTRPATDHDHDVVQAVVRDGSAELGLVGGVTGVVSTVTGTVGVTLGCSGLHDCRGSVEIRPVGASTRGVAARSAAHSVVLLRGRTRRVRLAVPAAALRGPLRARLVFRMSRVRPAAATRSVLVTLRRRG